MLPFRLKRALYWPRRRNGLEPSPRVVALNEEETAASQKEYEEPGVYWEESENPQTGEINVIKRQGLPKGSNPRRNPVYSTGTNGRKNYPSNNLCQQYGPKTTTRSPGTGQKYNQGRYNRRGTDQWERIWRGKRWMVWMFWGRKQLIKPWKCF